MTRRPSLAATERTAVFKMASILLGYPDRAVFEARTHIGAGVDRLPESSAREGLVRFLTWLDDTPPTQAAAHYVEVFDLRRRCCLYLSYYIHGDTRKRGMALLELKDRYRRAGLQLEGAELPDYLPVMLEFAAIAPADGGIVLAQHRHCLELLRLALDDAPSPYGAVVGAVTAAMARPTRADLDAVRRLISDGPPHEDVGLEPFAPPEFLAGADLPVPVSLSATNRPTPP